MAYLQGNKVFLLYNINLQDIYARFYHALHMTTDIHIFLQSFFSQYMLWHLESVHLFPVSLPLNMSCSWSRTTFHTHILFMRFILCIVFGFIMHILEKSIPSLNQKVKWVTLHHHVLVSNPWYTIVFWLAGHAVCFWLTDCAWFTPSCFFVLLLRFSLVRQDMQSFNGENLYFSCSRLCKSERALLVMFFSKPLMWVLLG